MRLEVHRSRAAPAAGVGVRRRVARRQHIARRSSRSRVVGTVNRDAAGEVWMGSGCREAACRVPSAAQFPLHPAPRQRGSTARSAVVSIKANAPSEVVARNASGVLREVARKRMSVIAIGYW